jgi:hypothetical protein
MKKNKYPVPKTAITERGLKKLLKEAAKDYDSIGDWARAHNITASVVSCFLRKTQGAGLQIPEALGYRPQVVFLPVDVELITTPNPPRRSTRRPSKKVDHSRKPLERKKA